MAELIDGFGGDATECIHGLTVQTCTWCLTKLRAPYRQALVSLGFSASEDVEDSKKDCELCPSRGACKHNRVFVRLPRPPRNAWGKGIPPYESSYSGPVAVMPKVYKATHRMKNGKWACDRCHDRGLPPEPIEIKDRGVLSAQRIFGL